MGVACRVDTAIAVMSVWRVSTAIAVISVWHAV